MVPHNVHPKIILVQQTVKLKYFFCRREKIVFYEKRIDMKSDEGTMSLHKEWLYSTFFCTIVLQLTGMKGETMGMNMNMNINMIIDNFIISILVSLPPSIHSIPAFSFSINLSLSTFIFLSFFISHSISFSLPLIQSDYELCWWRWNKILIYTTPHHHNRLNYTTPRQRAVDKDCTTLIALASLD